MIIPDRIFQNAHRFFAVRVRRMNERERKREREKERMTKLISPFLLTIEFISVETVATSACVRCLCIRDRSNRCLKMNISCFRTFER